MISLKEAMELVEAPLARLSASALGIKLRNRSKRFSLCTIMNVKSGGCSEDCAYCAQSARFTTASPSYPLKGEAEVLAEARKAKEAGASRFSLVASGRGIGPRQAEEYARLVAAIAGETGLGVCASLGLASRESLVILKEAGLSRYHHNLETSRGFFPAICTTHDFDERVRTIEAAQEAGLEVCSGGIMGLGEGWEERVSLALELARLRVHSVPINLLVPIKGTPMEARGALAPREVLRIVALFRHILPDIPIRVAGGRESVLGDFQSMVFMSGADAMLIGGYLTVRGRPVETDREMVSAISALWEEMLGEQA